MSRKKISAALLWSVFTVSVLPASAEQTVRPRLYADPQGRFSFQLAGDWVKLRLDVGKEVAGAFLLTQKVGDSRKVVAELLFSLTELSEGASFEEYVRAEDRRVVNSPGFSRIGQQEKLTLGGQPALKNRYALSPPGQPEKAPQRTIYQYYVIKEHTIWGITLSALTSDESVLTDVERTVLSSFQFSVPEDAEKASLDVFKKVPVEGPKGGFSLVVPEEWEVKQSEKEGASLRGQEAVVYAFSVDQDEAGPSPQNLAAQFLKQHETLKELRVTSQGDEDIGGEKGYFVEYSGGGEGRRWHARTYTFVRDKRAFFVYCVSPDDRWERNKDLLDRIVHSFSILTPPGKE